ncbi:uncharacterized protein LTR77_006502 [Saxophila tyrrhenica]|uniref:Uncharacterized protein n=1 Tax=Saxophila tyrrhenica TaxID=1690608 RepID=A0AAV9P826_9PEZI|nr:hypothetical protein LTR77_006502 [Saxophila tyrrhenica]
MDEDPCIFTPCGHAITVDSLDGTAEMQKYYDIEPLSGKLTGLKPSPEPFSIQDSKPCPECRGSLRNEARHGRIVRRAALDEHQDLAARLSKIEGDLLGSLDSKRKPSQSVFLEGDVIAQMGVVRRLKTSKRYNKLFLLVQEIAHFSQQLTEDEQPYQRVHDLVEIARCRNSSSDHPAAFNFESEELQLRDHLLSSNLLIRSHIILFSDIVDVQVGTPTVLRGVLRVDFSANRALCDELTTEAKDGAYVRQEAKALVLWAKLAAMECGIHSIDADGDGSGSQHYIDELNLRAVERLKDVEKIFAQQAEKSEQRQMRLRRERPDLVQETPSAGMEAIRTKAAEVRRMLHEGVSSTEMRMIVGTMSKEFGGTGHWYRCVNGHPFTANAGCPWLSRRVQPWEGRVIGQLLASHQLVTSRRGLGK